MTEDITVREIVEMPPGDYWIDSSGDGRARAIVTHQHELIVEQFGGGWSCLGVGVLWTMTKRAEHDGDGPDPWHKADLQVRQWEEDRAAADRREALVTLVADGLIEASDDTIAWTRVGDVARAFLENFDVTPKVKT